MLVGRLLIVRNKNNMKSRFAVMNNDKRAQLEFYINSAEGPVVHFWGDGWVGWNELRDAINEMQSYIRKSRVLVYDKEKFGTYRFEIVYMYDGTLKSIIQPSYNIDFTWRTYSAWAYKHIPKLYSFVRKYICGGVDKILHYISVADRALSKIVPDSFISWVRSKQLHMINKGFQEVLLRHPSIVHEFVSDVDCWEHIKPFGDYIVDGSVIHNMHWKRICDTDA